MKKYMEYCEIVCPPRKHVIDPRSTRNPLSEYERPFVVLGTDKKGELKYLLDDKKNLRRFPSVLDAANYLSKNEGWHLAKTYTGGTETYTHGYMFWVMAREVRIED